MHIDRLWISVEVARSTNGAASLLGSRVREGRLERHWTQGELADRVGASVDTLAKVERGDPTVALGIAFDAARIVGVPLFGDDDVRRSIDRELTNARLALLPSRVRTRRATMASESIGGPHLSPSSNSLGRLEQ